MCTRCEELEEELRTLKAEVYGLQWDPPKALGISQGQELGILRALIARDRPAPIWLLQDVAARDATHAIWGDVPNSQIKVIISKMRRKLRPWGLGIEVVWGVGYVLPPETRHRLLNWQAERAAA